MSLKESEGEYMFKENNMSLEEVQKLGMNIKNGLSLERLLGLKFCKTIEEVPMKAMRPLRDMKQHLSVCQAIYMVRKMGLTIALDYEDNFCQPGASALGLTTFTRSFDERHTKNAEAGKKMDAVLLERDEKLPKDTYKYIVIGAFEQLSFMPDVVIAYGTPGQIGKLCKTFTYHGEKMTSMYMGGVGCSLFSTVYADQCAYYGLPGGGEKGMAGVTDNEMNFAFPIARIADVWEGFNGTQMIMPYPTICSQILTEPPVPKDYKMTPKDKLDSQK